ncbi:MAG: acetyl-CoA carboxylase biotin carboxyl carrier protein [Bdellovibrionota bacterium]|jgi:acetyl-CoA carboxylase biotin carboxyl carrier protein
MNIDELEKIIQILEKTAVRELALEHGDTNIRIVRAVGASSTTGLRRDRNVPRSDQAAELISDEGVASSVEDDDLLKVESPIVGNYYSRPSPDAEPFVRVGSQVKKGDTLCIVEAMKFMNEIDAPSDGVIEKIFLSEGQVVEYGEVLFLIRPN